MLSQPSIKHLFKNHVEFHMISKISNYDVTSYLWAGVAPVRLKTKILAMGNRTAKAKKTKNINWNRPKTPKWLRITSASNASATFGVLSLIFACLFASLVEWI